MPSISIIENIILKSDARKKSPQIFPKVRRTIHRDFIRWYTQHASEFEVPLKFLKRTDTALDMSFEGLNDLVVISLNSNNHEIGVYLQLDGDWLNSLIFFESYPKKVTDGYICSLCLPEAKKLYTSREAIWLDHLYEPFLNWVNEILIPAQWIIIQGSLSKDGCSTVNLVKNLPAKTQLTIDTTALAVWFI